MDIGTNVLTLKPKTNLDSSTDFDSIVNFDFNGGLNMQGIYQIPSVNRIYNATGALSYVNVDIEAEAYNINQQIDTATDFDSIQSSGNIGVNVNVTPYLRLSDDGTTFSNWQVALSGTQYKAKYYDFKIELSTTDPNTTVIVKKFGYSIYR
jgi:hypothetical protein